MTALGILWYYVREVWYRLTRRMEPVFELSVSGTGTLAFATPEAVRFYARATASVVPRLDTANTEIIEVQRCVCPSDIEPGTYSPDCMVCELTATRLRTFINPIVDTAEFGRVVEEEFDADAYAELTGKPAPAVLFAAQSNWERVDPPKAGALVVVEDELGSWAFDPDAVNWEAPAIFREVAKDALKTGALHPPINENEFIDAVMERVLAVV